MEQFMDIVFQLFFLSCLALVFGNLALTNLYQKNTKPAPSTTAASNSESADDETAQLGSSKPKAG